MAIGKTNAQTKSGITPSGNINILNTDLTDVTNYATAQVVDSNLAAGNIKKDVNILGITGTYEGSGGTANRYYYTNVAAMQPTVLTNSTSGINYTYAYSGDLYTYSSVKYYIIGYFEIDNLEQIFVNGQALGLAPVAVGTYFYIRSTTQNYITKPTTQVFYVYLEDNKLYLLTKTQQLYYLKNSAQAIVLFNPLLLTYSVEPSDLELGNFTTAGSGGTAYSTYATLYPTVQTVSGSTQNCILPATLTTLDVTKTFIVDNINIFADGGLFCTAIKKYIYLES